MKERKFAHDLARVILRLKAEGRPVPRNGRRTGRQPKSPPRRRKAA